MCVGHVCSAFCRFFRLVQGGFGQDGFGTAGPAAIGPYQQAPWGGVHWYSSGNAPQPPADLGGYGAGAGAAVGAGGVFADAGRLLQDIDTMSDLSSEGDSMTQEEVSGGCILQVLA